MSGCLICCYFTEGSSSWLDQPKLGTMIQKSDVQVQKAEKIHTVHRGDNFSEAEEFQRAEKIQKAEKFQISEASLRMFVFDLRMPARSQSFVLCLLSRDSSIRRLVAVSSEWECEMSAGRVKPPFVFLADPCLPWLLY